MDNETVNFFRYQLELEKSLCQKERLSSFSQNEKYLKW